VPDERLKQETSLSLTGRAQHHKC